MQAKDLIKQFENRSPEIVFEWTDSLTNAKGWAVINSLRGGAAGGGTRMRPGLDKNEVLSLAKTMEIKFAVSGPEIGGAKSGIDFDPNDPRKEQVLSRWYKAVMPLLKNYYGTGGDLNIDEVKEVIPITGQYGLLHPQEGVLMGHFKPDANERDIKIRQLREGVSLPVKSVQYSPNPEKEFVVADLITGWGVSESVRHYYTLWGANIKGKRAIIQGWGNVAASAAYYLAQAGAKVVGIIDRTSGIIRKEGFSTEEIRGFFLNRENNMLNTPAMLSFEEINEKIWDVTAEIFIPGAASRLVALDNLERMKKAGLEVISCGANVPFADKEIFFGPIAEYADKNFSVIPDFIANCGMARTFAYLMQMNIELTDDGIFSDSSELILKTLQELHQINPAKINLMESAFGMVLKKILY